MKRGQLQREGAGRALCSEDGGRSFTEHIWGGEPTWGDSSGCLAVEQTQRADNPGLASFPRNT